MTERTPEQYVERGEERRKLVDGRDSDASGYEAGVMTRSGHDRRSSTTEPRALVYQMRDGLDCGCIPGHCKGHPPASPSVTWERPVAPEGENPYGLPSEWMERYLKDAVLHYGVQALTASTDPKQTLALLVRMLQQGVVAPEPVTDGEDADGYETRVIARAASDGDYSDLARLLYYNAHDKPFTEAIYFTERHLRTFAARLRARETPPEVVGYVAVAWAIEDHITWDADEGAEWIEEFGEFPETFGGVQTLYRRALPEDGGGES